MHNFYSSIVTNQINVFLYRWSGVFVSIETQGGHSQIMLENKHVLLKLVDLK